MNFPSTEFEEAVTSLCHGTATDDEAEQLQAVLQSSGAARDEYLWQVELHGLLASRGAITAVDEQALASESSRQAHTKPRPVVSRRLAWVVSAAALLGVLAISLWWASQNLRKSEPKLVKAGDRSPQVEVDSTQQGKGLTGASAMGVYRQNISFVAASDAPIIIGTGQKDPIELGAQIPYSQEGNTLHIWDWSQSTKSRVFKDTRLWTHERFDLSPEGRWLVWASGTILDLSTGDKTTIDLGGEYFFDNAGGKLERIQGLQFTPDGSRLGLLVSNLVVAKSDHPLRKQDFATAHSVQVVEFPAAKLVCEFEASFPIAFSQDGKRVVSATPPAKFAQQIVERSAETGAVVRKYEPEIREYAYAMCYSPNGKHLAVYDGVGEVLVWETATGEVAYRVDVRQAVQSSATLRFSPDGRHLAIGVFQKIYVVDAATGAVEATATAASANQIHWSADSKTFHVLSYVSTRGLSEGVDEKGQRTLSNMYPQVEKVDFDALRTKK
jgi:hypothetical protein